MNFLLLGPARTDPFGPKEAVSVEIDNQVMQLMASGPDSHHTQQPPAQRSRQENQQSSGRCTQFSLVGPLARRLGSSATPAVACLLRYTTSQYRLNRQYVGAGKRVAAASPVDEQCTT